MFTCNLRYWKRWKLATFRRFVWTRKIVKKGTPKDNFVLLGKRSKRAKDKQMNEKSLYWSKVRFATRTHPRDNLQRIPKIHQIFGFFGYYYNQILAVLRKIDIIRFSAFSGSCSFCFKNNINKNSIRKKLRIFLFFRKMFWKGRKFFKNYFNIRLNLIYLLYSFDGLSI